MPGTPVAPPPRVWEAIAAATGVATEPMTDDAPPPRTDAEVLPFRSRRRPLLLIAASLVAGAVIGAGAVAIVQDGDDGEPVTAVALDPLAGNEASGRAEVVVRDDGSRVVEVQLDATALDDEYYELWLIDREVAGMVPLGVVAPGTQTVELPADLDLGEFPWSTSRWSRSTATRRTRGSRSPAGSWTAEMCARLACSA